MNTLLRAVVRGAVYGTLRVLPRPVLVVVGVVALVLLVLANGAKAAVYESSCPVDNSTPPVQTDPVCERLTVLVAAIEALPQTDTEYDYSAVLAGIEANTEATGSPAEVSGVVALSAGDRQALDLVWIGVFLFAGVSFGIVFARSAWGEMKQWFHF